MDQLFLPADPSSIFDDEENQTLDMFVEMGKRKPNIKGTGRFKITSKRNKLLIIYFGSKQMKKPNNFSFLSEYLSSFFLLDVDIVDQFDAINKDTNTFTLNGNEYDINITTNSNKKKKRKKDENEMNDKITIDVFDLFDILVHSAKEPYYSIVGIFDFVLTEDNNPIMGRACGDRVCCISLPYCDYNIRILMSTITHELLHTMGIDHNTTERCVMNAIATENEWFFLSLTNLKKLKQIHDEYSKSSKYMIIKDDFLKQYHQGLFEVLTSYDNNNNTKIFCEEIEWLNEVTRISKLLF